jgi:hypothetical protein
VAEEEGKEVDRAAEVFFFSFLSFFSTRDGVPLCLKDLTVWGWMTHKLNQKRKKKKKKGKIEKSDFFLRSFYMGETHVGRMTKQICFLFGLSCLCFEDLS